MAEAALFSLVGKLLGQIATPPFRKAYGRLQSIWGAKKDLEKLQRTLQTIQAVLLDAEKKQQNSAAVRDWMGRVRDLLYKADDLFDYVATKNLLMQQQMNENKLSKKVPISVSKLINPIIAKKVKAIRKSLDDIAKDMSQFSFILSPSESQVSGLRERLETKPFVDEKVVFGRDDDKTAIVEFLFDMSGVEQSVSVIAIVGIGGMGKTTLAQLVYNQKKVENNFQKKWWACISDMVGETNVLERIACSIDKGFCLGRDDPKELITKSITSGGSYLLVLDDVWDNDLPIWFDIMSLLSGGAKGSKIIVSTRCLEVPRAMQMDKCQIHNLKGLSDANSWELFTRIAFTEKQENDPNWVSLGREIVNKCANVPLAIKCIAGVLRTKGTMSEWESIKNEKLLSDGSSIKSVLKLGYDHLQSDLKNCFAYCSLFPKDSTLYKGNLIYMWIAQGYVKPKENGTLEAVGHVFFMELFQRSFFQEGVEDECGEILCCKMHDLVHELAQDVAGKESLTLTSGWDQFHKNTRHLYLCSSIDISGNIPQSFLNANQLRSCLFEPRPTNFHRYSHSPIDGLDPLLTKFKLLRALDLGNQGMIDVPSCIGDLKHLRYLDLYRNRFTYLPDSLTKLVNLLTLNINHCWVLEELPKDFRKLINLRHLDIDGCDKLWHMPPRLGELTCLQRLSHFKVGKRSGCGSRLYVLAGLNLKGELVIKFEDGIHDLDEDECWKLPTTMQVLRIESYPGMRIPHWGHQIPSFLPNLVRLSLSRSSTLKHLPPFRCLPYLKILHLSDLNELEHVEDENEGGLSAASPVHSMPFFPCLEVLTLEGLPKLRGWSKDAPATTGGIYLVAEEECFSSFPRLSCLKICNCQVLKSMPLFPHLRTLDVGYVNDVLMQQLTSTSLSLETVSVSFCDSLKSFSGETLTSLRRLYIYYCGNLKNVYLAPWHLNVLEELEIWLCQEFVLWEEEKRGIDWDSLPNLQILILPPLVRVPNRLPNSLQQLQADGKFQIKRYRG